MPEMVLSRYRILRRLGAGGMGEVFAADDLRLGRPVALKFCLPASADPNARRLIEREARAASQLNHPNIATIHDYEEDEQGRPFLVMELLDGQTLAARMRAGVLPAREVLRIGVAVAAALEEAHHHGLLHRDIKPSNIFLTTTGQVKVLDFGLAVHYESEPSGPADDETRTAFVRGTPAYMSPEQACGGPLDARSDLFSLGTVLYECLSGQRPFAAATPTATLRQLLHHSPGPPGPGADVPPAVTTVVMNLLEKLPQQRPPDARTVRLALESLLEQGQRPEGWAWWRWAVACLLVALAGLLFSALPGLVRRNQLPESARHWYEDGVRAIQDGTYLRAIRLLEEAVRAAPDYAPARARLAQALLESDFVEKARQQALSAAPAGDSLQHLSREERATVTAVHHLVAGRLKESEAEFLRLTAEAAPERLAGAWFDLGRIRERGAWRKRNEVNPGAVEAYRAALSADPALAPAHLRLGHLFARGANPAAATRSFDEAARLYRAANNLEGEAAVECERADLAVRREQWPEADRAIARAIELARLSGNLQQSVFAYSRQVIALSRRNRLGEARAVAEESLAEARRGNSAILEARALLDLGSVLNALGRYADAEPQLLRGITLARESGNPVLEARARANLASLYQLMSRFTEAAAVLLPALEWYRTEGPPLEELQTQTLLARLKRSAGEFDQAFALFSTTRDRAYRVENLSAAAAAAHGMASIRLARERFRESITLFSAAAEDARKAGDAGFEGYAVCTQSAALRALGHWREAAAAAERGMQLARQGRNDRLLLACLPNAAAAYAVGAQPAQAQAALDELRAVSLRLEGARESPHLLSLQALLLYHGGQPAKASALCETRLLPAAKAPAATAETALVCSIYADRAGKLARAAELAAHATPYFAAQQLLHSHWLALALAGRLPEAAAARDRFEATLTPDDAAAYRTHPDVARCGRRLAN